MSWIITGTEKFDPDAAAYIGRVEQADQANLEPAVKDAYNAFFVGCKTDGTWNAIKASCILAGARTLNGALVPLVGPAPTNYNFVSADYNRKTGLIGNGSTKYLDSNRVNNDDPQDSCHQSVFASAIGNGNFIGESSPAVFGSTGFSISESRNRCNVGSSFLAVAGFIGTSRNATASYSRRNGGSTSIVAILSQPPSPSSLPVFARSGPSSYSNARLAFYSIGESLDLAKLDARVTALINAFSTAIP